MAPASSITAASHVLHGDAADAAARRIAEEAPVALAYNNVVQAVMMATPQDLEDFAWGFSLTEGIVADADEIVGVAVRAVPDGTEIDVTVEAEAAARASSRERKLVGRTSCGLCGVTSLAQAVVHPRAVGRRLRVAPAALERALAALPEFQPLNRATHAVHAAAWAAPDGRILLAREDVGRHNALDKLIGAMARGHVDPTQGFCIITSRCSTEMVQKAMMVGIEMLVAVSAPTGWALRLAEASGMTLVAVARSDAQTVFAHPERLGLAPLASVKTSTPGKPAPETS
jgi:FdhD protein